MSGDYYVRRCLNFNSGLGESNKVIVAVLCTNCLPFICCSSSVQILLTGLKFSECACDRDVDLQMFPDPHPRCACSVHENYFPTSQLWFCPYCMLVLPPQQLHKEPNNENTVPPPKEILLQNKLLVVGTVQLWGMASTKHAHYFRVQL